MEDYIQIYAVFLFCKTEIEVSIMKCAYCGKEGKGTKEHIISCAILDLFPECYITFDDARHTYHESDPMIKDVCADCNNNNAKA